MNPSTKTETKTNRTTGIKHKTNCFLLLLLLLLLFWLWWKSAKRMVRTFNNFVTDVRCLRQRRKFIKKYRKIRAAGEAGGREERAPWQCHLAVVARTNFKDPLPYPIKAYTASKTSSLLTARLNKPQLTSLNADNESNRPWFSFCFDLSCFFFPI